MFSHLPLVNCNQCSENRELNFSFRNFLRGEIRYQVERAALSVALNLSEGNAKLSQKDRARFFNISCASQKEVQTILIIIGNLWLTDFADKLGAMIYCLQRQVLLADDR